MKKKIINKIINISENLGWTIQIEDNVFLFSQYSPARQNFYIEITADNVENLVKTFQEKCAYFDCSEEAYMWLDDSGHGCNGAPYNMKDVYEDMEACLDMMEELCAELSKIR